MIDYKHLFDESQGVAKRKSNAPAPKIPEVVEDHPALELEIIDAHDIVAVRGCKSVLVPLIQRGEDYKRKAKDMKLDKEADLSVATELIGQGKKYIKVVKAKAKEHYDGFYRDYKTMLGFQNQIIGPVVEANKILQRKIDRLVNLLEVERREKEQREQEEARKLQEEIDKKQREQQERERNAAKKENREAVEIAPVKVERPVVPKEIKKKTQHGSLKTKPVLVHEITDLKSDPLRDAIIQYCGPAFKTLADTAIKKMIRAGAIGVKGIEGVKVTETFKGKHTSRS